MEKVKCNQNITKNVIKNVIKTVKNIMKMLEMLCMPVKLLTRKIAEYGEVTVQ